MITRCCCVWIQYEPNQQSELEAQGLAVDDPSPAADGMSSVDSTALLAAADDSEPALDIGSATRGSRLVSTSQV